MSISSSRMPGHKLLHERAEAGLDRCKETQSLEFKESGTWDQLRWGITKTILGMGNLRDGGLLIIGVSGREDEWKLTGIDTAHLKTFDVDTVVDQVNAYASPHVDLDIVRVPYSNGTDFLAIQVEEFTEIPIVCKRNSPDTVKKDERVQEGIVYVRPPGKPQTTRVMNAAQMRDLLELASEKRARRILETSRRIGMVPPTGVNPFDAELGGL